MINFKDLQIKPQVDMKFTGDKIALNKLVNTQITVLDYTIEASKVKEGTECLTLQIEKGGDKRVVFTGAKGLISQIRQVPKDKFPFTTLIIRNNEYYEFT